MSCSTSRPSFFGRLRSSKMISGRGASLYFPCRRRNSMASTPSLVQCRLLYTLPSLSASRVRRSSPGLSSTSRISTGLLSLTIRRLLVLFRQGEDESAAFTRPGFHPDMAAVALHHLLADGEADAGPGIFALVVQPLEHHEDALEILRLDADAVVPHRKFISLAKILHRHMDSRNGRGTELERIGHQVLEEL